MEWEILRNLIVNLSAMRALLRTDRNVSEWEDVFRTVVVMAKRVPFSDAGEKACVTVLSSWSVFFVLFLGLNSIQILL